MHHLNQSSDWLKKFHTSNNEGMDEVNRNCVMCSKTLAMWSRVDKGEFLSLCPRKSQNHFLKP
jgi:hypothetical protein